MVTSGRRVAFLVVGSARSGTTLVQRLACEIPGVGMPPETHFFSSFASELVQRREFPLTGSALREELERFSGLESSKDMVIDHEAIIEDLGNSADSPFEMFEAIVGAVAGPAEVLGEKTPGHLLWWRAIARAAPWMRFVIVVRDPRAVVASNLSMPWRDTFDLPPFDLSSFSKRRDLVFAARWTFDQQTASALLATPAPSRCLLLRYEDVVADPQARRQDIASFLGLGAMAQPEKAPAGIVLPWEPWKRSALDAVRNDRLSAWSDNLPTREAAQVAAICWRGMRRFHYSEGRPGALRAAWIRAHMGPEITRELRRYLEGYLEYERHITSALL